jgi:hypothetical protein
VALASEFPAVTPLSSLEGKAGFRLDGVAAGDNNGFSVAGAGDVEGDGFADLFIECRSARFRFGISSDADSIAAGMTRRRSRPDVRSQA